MDSEQLYCYGMMLAEQGMIEAMKAQSELNISEAVKEGKVQTIIIPHGMTMLGLK